MSGQKVFNVVQVCASIHCFLFDLRMSCMLLLQCDSENLLLLRLNSNAVKCKQVRAVWKGNYCAMDLTTLRFEVWHLSSSHVKQFVEISSE